MGQLQLLLRLDESLLVGHAQAGRAEEGQGSSGSMNCEVSCLCSATTRYEHGCKHMQVWFNLGCGPMGDSDPRTLNCRSMASHHSVKGSAFGIVLTPLHPDTGVSSCRQPSLFSPLGQVSAGGHSVTLACQAAWTHVYHPSQNLCC